MFRIDISNCSLNLGMDAVIILGVGTTNEKRRYNATPSLIG